MLWTFGVEKACWRAIAFSFAPIAKLASILLHPNSQFIKFIAITSTADVLMYSIRLELWLQTIRYAIRENIEPKQSA